MRDLAPYNIIMTALEKTDRDEFQRKSTFPDLFGQLSHQASQYFDLVLHQTVIQKEDKSERVLFTAPHDGATSKDRSGCLNVVEQPDLGQVFAKIKGV